MNRQCYVVQLQNELNYIQLHYVQWRDFHFSWNLVYVSLPFFFFKRNDNEMMSYGDLKLLLEHLEEFR